MDDPVHSLGKRDGSGHHKHNHGLALPARARLSVVLGFVLWGPDRVAGERATRGPQIKKILSLIKYDLFASTLGKGAKRTCASSSSWIGRHLQGSLVKRHCCSPDQDCQK